MRKMMTKEVTKTTVKVAKMVTENGLPKAVELPDQILLGNVSSERAQREVQKSFDEPVTVFGVEPETQIYEMSVEDFLKHASIKKQESEESQTA